MVFSSDGDTSSSMAVATPWCVTPPNSEEIVLKEGGETLEKILRTRSSGKRSSGQDPQDKILRKISSGKYPQEKVLRKGSSGKDPQERILRKGSSGKDNQERILRTLVGFMTNID